MKFNELLDRWAQTPPVIKTARQYGVHLNVEDAARIQALSEMFPGRSAEDLITDLLSVALQELEGAMPYRPGAKVISQDEQGDPIYEDVGPTARFVALVRKYREQLARSS